MSGWWAVSYVALWVLVIALAVLLVALAREVGTLHLRLGPRGALEIDDEGPPLGEAPVAIEAPGRDGRAVTVGGPGAWQMVLFVSPGCPICHDVLPSVEAVTRAERMRGIVVSDGDETLDTRDAAVMIAPDVARRYRVPGTPYVTILDAMGVVRAKGTVNNLEQVEGLVRTARRRLERELSGGAP